MNTLTKYIGICLLGMYSGSNVAIAKEKGEDRKEVRENKSAKNPSEQTLDTLVRVGHSFLKGKKQELTAGQVIPVPENYKIRFEHKEDTYSAGTNTDSLSLYALGVIACPQKYDPMQEKQEEIAQKNNCLQAEPYATAPIQLEYGTVYTFRNDTPLQRIKNALHQKTGVSLVDSDSGTATFQGSSYTLSTNGFYVFETNTNNFSQGVEQQLNPVSPLYISVESPKHSAVVAFGTGFGIGLATWFLYHADTYNTKNPTCE